MVQATLIYNSTAGSTAGVTPESLLDGLRAAGFDARYQPTSCEDDLDGALAGASGLVVVAGGDGTVRATATRLLKRDLHLAIIPLGTANNIARTLGINGAPAAIVAGLAHGRQQPFDVGHVRTPWFHDYFLEGAGFGLFAETLALYDPNEGKSIRRALKALTETLTGRQPRHFRLLLDGRDISGDYLMVEALNTTAIGLRLKLAPQADPGDGLLEIVRIREEGRAGLLSYAAALVREELHELPAVEVERGRRLTIAWDGFPIHLDAAVHPSPEQPADSQATEKAMVIVELLPAALTFWLPAGEEL
jgi:diacylglycerol kinase family enzyme